MTKIIWKTGGIVAGLMIAGIALAGPVSVSYTHLTLPTILLV